MQIKALYSHLNGHEYLLVHRKYLWDEVEQVIESVDAEACRTKISRERTMRGRLLYSPTAAKLAPAHLSRNLTAVPPRDRHSRPTPVIPAKAGIQLILKSGES